MHARISVDAEDGEYFRVPLVVCKEGITERVDLL